MKQLMALICIVFLLSCGEKQQDKKTSTETKSESTMETTQLSNKEKAVAILESLETGDQSAIAYINPEKYIQHNLAVADGLEGFGAVMQNAPEGGFKAKVVRAFEDQLKASLRN